MIATETNSGPERVGRDRGHQRRVDPAREAHHDVAEAVLRHVVAQPQLERRVHLGGVVQQLGYRPAHPADGRVLVVRRRQLKPRQERGAGPGTANCGTVPWVTQP